MWIFEGILYVILLLVFIRYDRKKRLWIKTVSQEEKFEHYLSELSATYGKQKNIEEAVAEVEESHTVTLPTEHSYVRIYGAMCAVIREDGEIDRHTDLLPGTEDGAGDKDRGEHGGLVQGHIVPPDKDLQRSVF